MSEFRKDPVSGRWIIIAPERAARPTDFPVERRYGVGGFCPFCEGNEDKTPPEVAAFRKAGASADRAGWQVRVVPNRFPALRDNEPLQETGDGLARRMTGYGIHEVIIECPKHVLSLNDLAEPAIRDVLRMYQERIINARDTGKIEYVMVFKNVGAAAGATVEHSHAQLIGMPVVPTNVRTEIRNVGQHFESSGKCLFCQMIEEELSAHDRLVYAGDAFVAMTPFASRFPFETWLMPLKHVSHYEEQPAETLDELALALRTILNRLDGALGSPAYNYLIHTSPMGERAAPHYHWHIEIIPSVTRIAGFEWGTGSYINPVLPESAAAFLREARKPERPAR